MTAPPPRSPTPAPAGLRLSGSILIAAATLGPLLVGSAVYTQRDVRNAADAVLQAEARAGPGPSTTACASCGPANAEVLRSFLEESREAGLRYVARVGATTASKRAAGRAPFPTATCASA